LTANNIYAIRKDKNIGFQAFSSESLYNEKYKNPRLKGLLPEFNHNNNFDNVLSMNKDDAIKYINSLGHEIGLHFESENINDSQDEIIKSLYQDKHLFELMTGVRPKVFSFHNPTQLMLIMKNYKYADMLNTYSEHYYDTENYISDSNGYWRFRNLIDVLNDESTKKLQVLTHPEWWTPEPLSPRPRIWRAHIGRAHDAHSRYIALLETLGRTDSEKSEE
jgi:hypothetical protein